MSIDAETMTQSVEDILRTATPTWSTPDFIVKVNWSDKDEVLILVDDIEAGCLKVFRVNIEEVV